VSTFFCAVGSYVGRGLAIGKFPSRESLPIYLHGFILVKLKSDSNL